MHYLRKIFTLALSFTLILILTSRISASSPAIVDCNLPNIECVEGEQVGNVTWTSGTIYVLTDDYIVPATATLTITSDTVIKAQNAADLIIEGELRANGTADNPIYITSEKDDTVGGDTNQDGGASTPAPDDWDNIQFLGGTGILTYVEIRYAGGNPSFSSDDGAIYLQESSPTLSNVTIKNARRSAISAAATDKPIIDNLQIEATPFAGIEIRSGELTSDMTWGYTDVVYILDDDLTIAQGATLELEPGVTIKLDSAADINVNGTLNAIGTSANPITLTSIKNDDVSGDTNSDGAATAPAVDDWDSIIFSEGSSGSFAYVDISYSGGDSNVTGAIYTENSSLTVSNCILFNNQVGVRSVGDLTAPTVNSCDIVANQDYGIHNVSDLVVLNAENNWWGSNQGPNDPSDADGVSNISSRGDNVSDYVDYDPWETGRTQAMLNVDKETVTFNATVDAGNPGTQLIAISNLGDGALAWTASESIPWLTLGAVSGNTPSQLPLTVDTVGLATGTYTGTIEIISNGARFSPRTINVQLVMVNVADANPLIEVSANSLAFNVAFAGRDGGENPDPQPVMITNSGTGTLNWSATESIPWLTLDQTSGVAQSIINASVDISNLEEGTYTGEVIVESPTAENSPASIEILLVVGCSNVRPVDVMLVVDRSGSMSEPDISTFNNAKIAANLFVDQIDLTTNQLGLVTFYGVASKESGLSVDGDQIKGYIADLTVDDANNPLSGTNIADALIAAQAELESDQHRSWAEPVIILLSDGEHNRGGDPIAVANAAKAAGIRIITIALGEFDETTLKAIASSESDYYAAPTSEELIEIYSNISVNIGCAVELYLPLITTRE